MKHFTNFVVWISMGATITLAAFAEMPIASLLCFLAGSAVLAVRLEEQIQEEIFRRIDANE